MKILPQIKTYVVTFFLFSSISRWSFWRYSTALIWYISTLLLITAYRCQIKGQSRGTRTLSGFAYLCPKAPLSSPWPLPIGKKPFRGQMPFRFLSLMSQKQRRKTSPSHLCHAHCVWENGPSWTSGDCNLKRLWTPILGFFQDNACNVMADILQSSFFGVRLRFVQSEIVFLGGDFKPTAYIARGSGFF